MSLVNNSHFRFRLQRIRWQSPSWLVRPEDRMRVPIIIDRGRSSDRVYRYFSWRFWRNHIELNRKRMKSNANDNKMITSIYDSYGFLFKYIPPWIKRIFGLLKCFFASTMPKNSETIGLCRRQLLWIGKIYWKTDIMCHDSWRLRHRCMLKLTSIQRVEVISIDEWCSG